MGTIQAFAFGFTPANWLPCNGQLLPVSQYTALFSLLGVQFGGNGSTTFGLPNLQGRVPVGQGNGVGLSPVVMGQMAGSNNVTLNVNNLPAHAHAVAQPINTAAGTAASPAGAVPAVLASTSSTRGETVTANGYATSATAGSTEASFNTGLAGGNQPVATQPPYVGINFCICVNGLYPSRA